MVTRGEGAWRFWEEEMAMALSVGTVSHQVLTTEEDTGFWEQCLTLA